MTLSVVVTLVVGLPASVVAIMTIRSKRRSAAPQWVAECIGKYKWLLRKVGTSVASNTTVDRDALGGVRVDITPNLPADIHPGESIKIEVVAASGASVADEVRVSWGKGRNATIALPTLK
jgi:hypothetical protein